MAEQSLLAIEEADVVLFMVDARAGLTAADQAIAEHLRKTHKKVFLVANKTDGIDGDSAVSEFYGLALGEVYQMAAAHGRGVLSLLELALAPHLETLVDAATQETAQDEEEEDFDEEALLRMVAAGELDTKEDTKETPFADLPIKFAIVGRPNVGKSTLTNRMLGEDRVIVYDMPGLPATPSTSRWSVTSRSTSSSTPPACVVAARCTRRWKSSPSSRPSRRLKMPTSACW